MSRIDPIAQSEWERECANQGDADRFGQSDKSAAVNMRKKWDADGGEVHAFLGWWDECFGNWKWRTLMSWSGSRHEIGLWSICTVASVET